MDRPLDLSFYLLTRTKERMLLESILQTYKESDSPRLEEGSAPTNTRAGSANTLESQLHQIKQDIDLHFAQLDRLLTIASENEQEFDFPVAFVTNVMYVCYKNKVEYLLEKQPYFDLLLKKMNFLHAEGIAHAAYALQQAGVTQGPIWDALHEQVLKRDTFQVALVKNNNYDPSSFEYAGLEGGAASKTVEHIQQNLFSNEAQKLIYEDQYAIFELQAAYDRLEALDQTGLEAKQRIGREVQLLDASGSKQQVFKQMSSVYAERLALVDKKSG